MILTQCSANHLRCSIEWVWTPDISIASFFTSPASRLGRSRKSSWNDKERPLSMQDKAVRSTPDEATVIAWGLFCFTVVAAVTIVGLYLGFRS